MRVSPAPPVETKARDNQVARGMALMVVAMLTLPLMDGMAKLLTLEYDVSAGQTTFGRFLVQSILLGAIIAAMHGVRALIPSQLLLNLLRGALMSMAVMLFFATLRYMPVADALAVFFLEPFILTILSVIVLKEKVGWRRGLAVVIGFAGAMLIVQPSYAVFGPVSLMPIGTAFLFATYLILTRIMASKDRPITMQFASGVGGVITLFVVVALATLFDFKDFSSPGIPEFGIRWALIFAIGALASFGHLVIVMAFRLASASILAPFQYLEIVTGTLIGYYLFGDFPDAWKWLGIFIIIASGIYLFLRERRAAATAPATATAAEPS